jgi:hypothetical protein
MKPTPFNEMGRENWQQVNAPWGFSKDLGLVRCSKNQGKIKRWEEK